MPNEQKKSVGVTTATLNYTGNKLFDHFSEVFHYDAEKLTQSNLKEYLSEKLNFLDPIYKRLKVTGELEKMR